AAARRTAEEADALLALAEELERDLDAGGHEAALGIEGIEGIEGAEEVDNAIGRGRAELGMVGSRSLQSKDGSGPPPTPARRGGGVIPYVSRRRRSAELRRHEAPAARGAGELASAPPAELERLERAFLMATAAYSAARSLSERVTSPGEAMGEAV